MACVPKKGSPLRKWFTDLAKGLNVSEEWLEPQIHSYWEAVGEDKTPTLADMESFLHKPNIVTSQAQMDVWDNHYSEPITGLTLEQAQSAAAEAGKYFVGNPILISQEPNGKYTVTVTKPTLKETTALDLKVSPAETKVVETPQINMETTRQVDNLVNNTVGLTSSEIQEIANECVYWISDLITDYLEDPTLVFNTPKFASLRTLTDGKWSEENQKADIAKVKRMSRVQLVKFLGPQNIMDLCRETLFEQNPALEDVNAPLELIDQAALLSDNFDGLMMKGSAAFTEVEKFSITYNPDVEITDVLEETNVDADNFNESEDIDVVREEKGDAREHYGINSRTIDVLGSMSQLVRAELTKCYQIDGFDEAGNPIYSKSKFGVRKRVDARTATNQLLSWTQGSITYEDMVSKIQDKLQRDSDGKPTKNLWLTQLLDKLTVNPGKPNPNTQFQSQFFGVFNKHFQAYSIVTKKAGSKEVISTPVNQKPALRDVVNGIQAQYRIGEHPLFNFGKGVNKTNLEVLKKAAADIDSMAKTGNTYKSIAELGDNVDNVVAVFNRALDIVGCYVTPEMVEEALKAPEALGNMARALNYITSSLAKEADNAEYEPFKVDKLLNPNGIYGDLRKLLTPITDLLEDTAMSSFYDNGNMYQSHVTPSYLTKLMNKFHLEGRAFDDFIMSEYGNTEWFHDGANIERGWKNEWLRTLVTMPAEKRKELFQHDVQVSHNKHNYMRTMSDTEYAVSIFERYILGTGKSDVAFYRIPIQSNKPSSEFISFYKRTGDFTPGSLSPAKSTLVDGFTKIFVQELGRIMTCEAREASGITEKDPRYIKNFDKNGKKFMFLDFLNAHVDGGTELGKLITAKKEGKTVDENTLNTKVREAIIDAIDNRATQIYQSWRANGIVEAIEQANLVSESTTTENAIREFVWNDASAAMNILQLTVTDIALYKDAEDLQKRLAQLHAPGIRANVSATDFKGVKVSDGISRTLYLTDFDKLRSNVIENVGIVFQRKADQATSPAEKEAYTKLKRDVIDAFEHINLADAQAFSSPTSLRKKMFMFGKWGREQEAMYQKLRKGKYNYNDLQTIFSQPLKPFVYSQVVKTSYVKGPIRNIKVGIQNKNSEYLLLMADALLHNEDTGKPNLLRAIYQVMEESHYDANGEYKDKGLDTVQFESAVKVNVSGRLDLRAFSGLYPDMYKFTSPAEAEAAAKKALKEAVYAKDGSYRSEYIHEFPYEDYCIQQEVPEHFRDHEQVFGSQTRYIIPSDLETLNARGDAVTYNFYDPATGKEQKLSASEFKKLYEQTVAQNIEESLTDLRQELFLDNDHLGDIKSQNIALSKILQREIISSPRYGVDLLQACSVDENGKFRIPLGDPIQAKRVEQLINSIIKNRIHKQMMPGGPVVQVSNFGASKALSIRFKDEAGNILPSKSEYKGSVPYEQYIKEHQRGIAYWECYAPIPNNDIFYKFADENGNIDIAAIEKTDPELLKMIGYRIPTEDKYSIMPLKIVGFLPREAGEAIMLPADVTCTTGSDFDIDKIYLMRKSLSVTEKDAADVVNQLVKKAKTLAAFKDKSSEYITDKVKTFMQHPTRKYTKDTELAALGKVYKNLAYTTITPTEGREYRNNLLLDMAYSVLTEETTADKMLNPGGFEQQKRIGYMVQALRQNPSLKWGDLLSKDIDDLKKLCYTGKNLSFIDTQVQFYKQNSAAASILGMFAVQKVAHAALEGDGYQVDVAELCNMPVVYAMDGDGEFLRDRNGNLIPKGSFIKVAGFTIGDEMEVDAPFDKTGVTRVGKVLGSLVASAADAVKDPVLNLMNINSQTANVLTTLVRLGMPFEDAALFLSQKVIGDVLSEYDSRNIVSFTRLTDVIGDRLKALSAAYDTNDSKLTSEELTKEELVKGIYSDDPRIQYKTLRAYQYISDISKAIKGLTTATRFNSIAAAVGPLVIDNLIMEHKENMFSQFVYDHEGNKIEGIQDVFAKHPILKNFEATFTEAKQLLRDMPANSSGFRNLLTTITSFEDAVTRALGERLYNDRKLLSQLSDFYQSYVLQIPDVAGKDTLTKMAEVTGIPENQRGLDYYVNKFVADFTKAKIKERYANNLLIQSIKVDSSKTSNRAFLRLDTTGLDAQQKEKLSAAWADLHKDNPALSVRLFLYNFYRGGIGFNPKTFMSLLPTTVKASKEFAPYVDTFRKLPPISVWTLYDQFVRNNANNNKLAPLIVESKPNWTRYQKEGILSFQTEDDVAKVKDNEYIRMRIRGLDTLFKLSEIDKTNPDAPVYSYTKIDALGNSGEYFETSSEEITRSLEGEKAIIAEKNVDSVLDNSEIRDTENVSDEESTNSITPMSPVDLHETLIAIFQTAKSPTREAAQQAINKYKSMMVQEQESYKTKVVDFMTSRMKELDIPFNQETVDNLYKTLC